MIEKVRELFSCDEQDTFPYIAKYMNLVSPRLDEILADSRSRERFMLAGLFLTFRACNHAGVEMTTEERQLARFPPLVHADRLRSFRLITGHEIRSDCDYLKIIKYILSVILMSSAYRNPGVLLFTQFRLFGGRWVVER